MKVYLFNVENGLYAGETFEDAGMLAEEEGMTTIAPPLHDCSQVPVFNRERQQWELISVGIARQLLHLDDGCSAKEKRS
ncbi:hypothetical protein [Trichlorobacter ammonificans]|uniref:Uncharacterized protein n=1 Tax=Trichlorobacter ammonificans TaxID=2916410 RepID=A0ABM9DAQ8_9BACT|nr:hypothetical protein [Trichlorobacter ammonificans]CAH2032308.1 conserved protein of unknown function [Trichlorobacter ammonificans]